MELGGIKVVPDRESCRKYEKCEFEIKPVKPGIAVLDVRYVVEAEGGETISGKGFTYRECLIDESLSAIVMPAADAYWKVRYSPSAEGTHRIRLEVDTSTDGTAVFDFTINVSGMKGRGFIKPGKGNRYFEFANGDPYFAIGINAINLQSDFIKLGEDIKRLAENGCNYIRLWISQSEVPLLSREEPGIRQDNAWGYDYIMDIAEQYGIYVKLCFEHMRWFVNVENVIWSDHESMFSYKKGGPCEHEYDFFSKAEVREMYKKKVVDYIIARWGHSTNIFAWELWNEIDTVKGGGTDFQSPMWEAIVDWSRDMGNYIKQQDCSRHMVVNSMGSYVVRKEMWELEAMDFVQVHGYWKADNFTVETAKDISIFVEEYLKELKPFNKPALFAEYGLVNMDWGSSVLQYADRKGTVIHDGAWCALACGSAGTAMFWWGSQLVEMGLEWVFKGISSFTKGMDFVKENFQDVFALCNKPEIKVRGVKGDKTTILWLKNKNHSWWNEAMSVKIPKVQGAVLEVYNHYNGDYMVQVWDTGKGEIIDSSAIQCLSSKMVIRLPRITADCAVKILKL